MLQALKNLEARGERVTAVPSAAAPLEPPAAPESLAATQAVTNIDFATAQLASLSIPLDDHSLVDRNGAPADWSNSQELAAVVEVALGTAVEDRAARDLIPASETATRPADWHPVPIPQSPVQATEPAIPGALIPETRDHALPSTPDSLPASQPVQPVATALDLPTPTTPTTDRPLTSIERAALRTLNNPLQARPVIDLADRLEAETGQTSHSVVLVSVGDSRGTPEALVCAGALLAERRHTDLLIVDADLTRRALTAALAAEAERGLSEALLTEADYRSLCQALATRNLKFLPTGLKRDLDAAAIEARLEALLKSLGAAYGLLLIDGGQAGRPFTSTLARQADATYLVLELGAVEASQAQDALRDLRAAGARVLGCIAT
jgi:Mrp family chromosome partitioning ATPase